MEPTKLGPKFSCNPPGDFSNLFAHFLKVSDDLRAEIFIIISWLLWNRHNCLWLGLQSIHLNQIVQKAGGLLQDFLTARIRIQFLPSC